MPFTVLVRNLSSRFLLSLLNNGLLKYGCSSSFLYFKPSILVCFCFSLFKYSSAAALTLSLTIVWNICFSYIQLYSFAVITNQLAEVSRIWIRFLGFIYFSDHFIRISLQYGVKIHDSATFQYLSPDEVLRVAFLSGP